MLAMRPHPQPRTTDIEDVEDSQWWRAYPVVLCDWCSQVIERGDQRNILWEPRYFHKGTKHGASPVYFVHKECCRSFEDQHGGWKAWHWMPLRDLPRQVAAEWGVQLSERRYR